MNFLILSSMVHLKVLHHWFDTTHTHLFKAIRFTYNYWYCLLFWLKTATKLCTQGNLIRIQCGDRDNIKCNCEWETWKPRKKKLAGDLHTINHWQLEGGARSGHGTSILHFASQVHSNWSTVLMYVLPAGNLTYGLGCYPPLRTIGW